MTQGPTNPQNPFDGLGGEGGFDVNALLQQAQQMQEQLVEAQQRLTEMSIDGTVGDVVTVTLTGGGELTGVRIAPGAVEGADAESLSDLGDMIVAAYRDARAKTDELAAEALGPLAGGGSEGPGGGMPGLGQLGF